MDDISIQLRRWSTALADSAPITPIDEVESGPPTTPGGRSRTRVLAAAASVVVVGAGITAIAVFGSDNDPAPTSPTEVTTPESSTTTPSSTSTTSTTAPPAPPVDRLAGWPARPSERLPVDAVPLLAPTVSIPHAQLPVRGAIEPVGNSLIAPTFTQVFANEERDALIRLQTQPNGVETTPPSMRRATTIDGWDSAFQARDCTTCPVHLVANDSGGWVRLIGTGLDEAEAETIVQHMRGREPGVPGWDLPPGSDLVEISAGWNDNDPERHLIWYVPWATSWRPVAEMYSSAGLADLVGTSLGTEFERVDINGVEGWYRLMFTSGTVVWSPDGVTTVVLRVSDAGIDALTLARSFIEVDEATYNSMTTTERPEGLGDGCQSLFC